MKLHIRKGDFSFSFVGNLKSIVIAYAFLLPNTAEALTTLLR